MTDPALTELDDFLINHALVLAVRPTDTGLARQDAVDILISDARGDVRLTVFDEYDDAATGDPRLLCVLCAQELGELDDADDYRAWHRAHCLPDTPQAQAAYIRNMATRTRLMDALDDWPDVIPDLEWQLNSGLAYQLRQSARKPA
ncbi:hypothetical protein [Maricaulis parjimensis]|uniref:hypothetical protein n=1 Tax=Maricaulis parjimensis TaxID=144023 RepID=UPI00193A97B4|nr:hypothetical protein [Maricaulis parjimensis]